MPYFIEANNWPSSSPDLNPLDYKLWRVLEERACTCRYPNLVSLKAAIVKAAGEIPLEVIHECIDEWPKRLRLCIAKKGSYFLLIV